MSFDINNAQPGDPLDPDGTMPREVWAMHERMQQEQALRARTASEVERLMRPVFVITEPGWYEFRDGQPVRLTDQEVAEYQVNYGSQITMDTEPL